MVSTSKRIRILFTIPNFDTAGSGKALLHVAKRLNPEVFDVHIACFHSRGAFFKVVESSGIPVHIIQYTTSMRPYLKGLRQCYKISRALKVISPDIIHSFHYSADYSEPIAARMAGIKWVFTKKNMNWGRGSKNAWHLRTRLANAIAVQNTDMIQEFFSDKKKTRLIPRGVDTTLFIPKLPERKLQKDWHVSESDRIVMCVANLVPVKGIEVLLHAFKDAIKDHDDWKLFLVGDYNNPYGLEMKALKDQLNLANRAIFCGKQQQIVDYLSLAEMVVLPTLNEGRKEGSPVALLEAMATGKNVLASNISGINDQLSNYPEHLVEAGHIGDWTKKLVESFILPSEIHQQRGQEFRQHVVTNYPIELEVERCEQLYLSLCKKVK